MAMLVREIEDWLVGLPEDAAVGVDDGGLCLRVVGDEAQYCEIGGMPGEEREETEPENCPVCEGELVDLTEDRDTDFSYYCEICSRFWKETEVC